MMGTQKKRKGFFGCDSANESYCFIRVTTDVLVCNKKGKRNKTTDCKSYVRIIDKRNTTLESEREKLEIQKDPFAVPMTLKVESIMR